VKFFKTKYEKDAAKITTLLAVILLLLIFVVGPKYLDPPQEYGVAINFGTTDYGSGNKPLSQPQPAKVEKVVEETPLQATPAEPEASAPVTKTKDVLTQQTEDAEAIRKEKEVKAKAERIDREKREAEEKKKREKAEKKRQLDNLIGGVKNAKGNDNGGEGNDDNRPSNKGQLNGDPYAPSYFGGSGPGKGGVGYGLGGRGRPSRQIYKQDCNEYGLVVVRIEVNRQGKVIKATPGIRGTTNTHPCLLEPAKKIAESHKWPTDSKAPAIQIGFVSINFDVGQ
jgi:membrane protein involved in colicin uptake